MNNKDFAEVARLLDQMEALLNRMRELNDHLEAPFKVTSV